jgi:hypothetical protein
MMSEDVLLTVYMKMYYLQYIYSLSAFQLLMSRCHLTFLKNPAKWL